MITWLLMFYESVVTYGIFGLGLMKLEFVGQFDIRRLSNIQIPYPGPLRREDRSYASVASMLCPWHNRGPVARRYHPTEKTLSTGPGATLELAN